MFLLHKVKCCKFSIWNQAGYDWCRLYMFLTDTVRHLCGKAHRLSQLLHVQWHWNAQVVPDQWSQLRKEILMYRRIEFWCDLLVLGHLFNPPAANYQHRHSHLCLEYQNSCRHPQTCTAQSLIQQYRQSTTAEVLLMEKKKISHYNIIV